MRSSTKKKKRNFQSERERETTNRRERSNPFLMLSALLWNRWMTGMITKLNGNLDLKVPETWNGGFDHLSPISGRRLEMAEEMTNHSAMELH